MPDFAPIFSRLCSSTRCFIIDGTPLPLCQRCLGLYVGALLTLVVLVSLRIHRRGLPPAWLLLTQTALLALATLGGLHIIDTGPAWRFACGLWTGHIAVAWMISASSGLTHSDRWRSHQQTAVVLLIAALSGLAAAAPLLSFTPRFIWPLLALGGIAAIIVAGCFAVVRIAVFLTHRSPH